MKNIKLKLLLCYDFWHPQYSCAMVLQKWAKKQSHFKCDKKQFYITWEKHFICGFSAKLFYKNAITCHLVALNFYDSFFLNATQITPKPSYHWCQSSTGSDVTDVQFPMFSYLMRVEGKAGVKKASHVYVIVVVDFVHVIRRVPDLHVQAAVRHGLPLHSFASVKRYCIYHTQPHNNS